MYYPEPMGRLIAELRKLPGIGPRTAQRLAFHILDLSNEEAQRLMGAIAEAREKLDTAPFAATWPPKTRVPCATIPAAITA